MHITWVSLITIHDRIAVIYAVPCGMLWPLASFGGRSISALPDGLQELGR